MENRTGAVSPDAAARVMAAADAAASDVKDAAKGAMNTVSAKAGEALADAQTAAADRGRSAAEALRRSADSLEGDAPWMDTAFRRAADGIDHLTNAIREGDLKSTVDTVSDFARRQPAVFLGLSVAVGFALARVGKVAMDDVVPGVETGDAD